jgi:hypothetical protein
MSWKLKLILGTSSSSMPSPIFISRPPSGFSALSVVRGLQLTILGGYRALLNPDLAKHGYYRKAAEAIVLSIIVQLVVWAPLVFFQWILMLVMFIFRVRQDGGIADLVDMLRFVQNHVLNVGPLLISLVRYWKPDMDDLFLESIRFVDKVYKKKHPNSNREYYSAIMQYQRRHVEARQQRQLWHGLRSESTGELNQFLKSYAKRVGFTLLVYVLSSVPVVGRFVLPLVSFRSFNRVVGTNAAVVVFGVGMLLPRRAMLVFLSAFWGGRSLVHELLQPYFRRVPFSTQTKAQWFANREGIMFGFGAGFFLLLKIPFLGVLVYGFAQASAAYLITKITDPPPGPNRIIQWTESQAIWTTKDEHLATAISSDGFGQLEPSSLPGAWNGRTSHASQPRPSSNTPPPSYEEATGLTSPRLVPAEPL